MRKRIPQISDTKAIKQTVRKARKERKPSWSSSEVSPYSKKLRRQQTTGHHHPDYGRIAVYVINNSGPQEINGVYLGPPYPDQVSDPKRMRKRINKKLRQPFRRKPRRAAKAAGKREVRPQRGMR